MQHAVKIMQQLEEVIKFRKYKNLFVDFKIYFWSASVIGLVRKILLCMWVYL